MTSRFGFVTTAAGLALGSATIAHADQVVQVPVDAILTGRAVSTFTAGAVVPWTMGVDRNDGLMTVGAVAFLKQTGVALPDDGKFAADARHPEVVLHFSNSAPATSQQNAYLEGISSLEIPIPGATYSKMFLFLTDGANGATPNGSPLTIRMVYADTTSAMVSFTLPDYGTGAALPTDPPIFFNLISGMHKWNKDDQSVDAPTHAITGVELSPAADKVLTTLQVNKLDTGKVVTFFGATGIATSALDAGGAVGTDGGGAVESGIDAAPLEASALATTGAGGASGGAGVGGAAGSLGVAGSDAMGSSGATSVGSPTGAAADSGCGCVIGGGSFGSSRWSLVMAAGAALLRRRRTRARTTS